MRFIHFPSKQKVKRHLKPIIKLGIIDFTIVLAAYFFAFSVRTITVPLDYIDAVPFILSAVIIVVTSLYIFQGYHRIWAQTSGHSIISLILAVGLATLVLLGINYFLPDRQLPNSVIILAHILSLSGIVAIRYRSRLFSGLNWRWRAIWHREFPDASDSNRVLIIGSGESGQTLAWRLKHRFRTERYKIIGFIDDDPDKHHLLIEGSPVLGGRGYIPEAVETYNINLVIVAIHNIDGQDFRDILNYCEKTKARIKVVPDMLALLDNTQHNAPLRDVQPEDLIGRSTIERHSAVDLSPIINKVVLITGAAGSIGSELVRQMASYNPKDLIILDNNESELHNLYINLQAKHPALSIIQVLGDVTDYAGMHAVFNTYKPQVVFHAAAYKHVPILEQYPHQALHVNVRGTLNAVSLAQRYEAERFVLISTDKAVNPSSIMGASKRVCEFIVHAHAKQKTSNSLLTAVRFGNVLGSRGSVVPTFNRQIDIGGPITVTHQEMTRYFMSIAEAVNLVIHAGCMTTGDEIFLLRMGEKVRILDIAERMIRLRGMRPYIDIPITFTGVRPGEKLHEELHDDRIEKPSETLHPSIFKLNGWEATFDEHYFLSCVHDLLEHGFISGADPLEMLVNLTEVNYDPVNKGD